jgi:hypothetical protein
VERPDESDPPPKAFKTPLDLACVECARDDRPQRLEKLRELCAARAGRMLDASLRRFASADADDAAAAAAAAATSAALKGDDAEPLDAGADERVEGLLKDIAALREELKGTPPALNDADV